MRIRLSEVRGSRWLAIMCSFAALIIFLKSTLDFNRQKEAYVVCVRVFTEDFEKIRRAIGQGNKIHVREKEFAAELPPYAIPFYLHGNALASMDRADYVVSSHSDSNNIQVTLGTNKVFL